jgi:hypothetical protein
MVLEIALGGTRGQILLQDGCPLDIFVQLGEEIVAVKRIELRVLFGREGRST